MKIMPSLESESKPNELRKVTENGYVQRDGPSDRKTDVTLRQTNQENAGHSPQVNGDINKDSQEKPSVEPVDYQPETVDFPDSPQPQKRLITGAQDFVDPLTSYSSQADTLASPSFDQNTEPYSLRQNWNDPSNDEYFEDSIINSACVSLCESEPMSLEWSHMPDNVFSQNYYSGPISPLKLPNGPIRFSSSSPTEPLSLQSIHSTTSENVPDLDLLRKIKDCFDQERIKDLYVLSGRLQDMLSPLEIEEIVINPDLYSGFIDDDMFEVFSAAHAEISGGLSRGGSIRDSRRKIRPSLSSIADVQEDIKYRAVFDCHSNTLRNSIRRKKPVPIENVRKMFDESTSNSITNVIDSQVKIESTFDLNATVETSSDSIKPPSFSEDNGPKPNHDTKPNIEDSVISEPSQTSHIEVKVENLSSETILEDAQSLETTERPEGLANNGTLKRKIRVNTDILNSTSQDKDDDQKSLSSISNKSDIDVLSPMEDLVTPDDIDTPEDIDDSVFDKFGITTSEIIPELSAVEELQEERSWKTCLVGGIEQKIDMKVIEPYKKVLSHGGYFGPNRHAIIVFSACYLPDHSRRDYDYVMDNLFYYVLITLEQLVAEDYILVYLHGATDKNNMPTFGWLKRCYQMIDRRLRKNLKGLYLVHPTFWLKTIVIMTKPFISSKFSRKLKFVACLKDLSDLIPMDHVCIPDKVKQLEFQLMISKKKKELKQRKRT